MIIHINKPSIKFPEVFKNIYNLIHQATQMPDETDLTLNKQNQRLVNLKIHP